MLKRIDELGRIVVPAPFRDEIGVKVNEYVDMKIENDKIIIQKTNKMLSQQAIEHFYKELLNEYDTEYNRGCIDTLKFILGKGESENDEGR